MELHRNSQKRIYVPDTDYFVTTNTCGRVPFFREDLFARMFFENIMYCQRLKGFLLYGLSIVEEHSHVMFRPNINSDHSKIMQNIKRNFSRDINVVMGYRNIEDGHGARFDDDDIIEGDNTYCRLHTGSDVALRAHRGRLTMMRRAFIEKYGIYGSPWPRFQWQKSFYDHYIRNEHDHDRHLNYILRNPIKHQKKGYVYIDGYEGDDDTWRTFLKSGG